jgi:hypothetical protein
MNARTVHVLITDLGEDVQINDEFTFSKSKLIITS